MPEKRASFVANSIGLLKQTFSEWLEDKVPRLGAALAYYTVFSLARWFSCLWQGLASFSTAIPPGLGEE